MENLNETNINTLTDKNETSTCIPKEIEETDQIEQEITPENIIKPSSHILPKTNITEDKKKNIKTKLEHLLSQNDILPILKFINNNKLSTQTEIEDHINLLNRKSQESINKNGKNARSLNKNDEKDLDELEEEDNEYRKLIVQPENLCNGELKEYQLEALNWMIKLHYMNVNAILADEMGLGKTIQTISLLAHLEQIRENKHLPRSSFYIVIVPKVTLNNWLRELKKWLPDLKVLVFYGDKEERKILTNVNLKQRDYDLILTTYECAIIDKSALTKLKYEYLIIDEAHRIKNENSKLATIVRQYTTNHRLLLTGTPLQNNLHELWALLNFLMPQIFDDSEDFDQLFDLNTANEEGQQVIVKQIHQLLRPFVLRRLKNEVEIKLPTKKEVYLFVGLSEMQKSMYKQILTKNIDVVNGVSKDKIQLLNILMQLKKVCNHPYLFPRVEPGPPYLDGEHLVFNSMKLKILDVLLKRLRNEGSKVLIFSQMTSLLNIIDDYCRYRGFSYCRLDGSTSSADRDARIEEFQDPNAGKFIFLLSTRAGGLGINLHQANTVILYDSDWNPQVDLQAIDRAHRIGQTRNVKIYRFVTEGSVEEKIVERAAKKLKIDHLIIQKGKATVNKVTALDISNMIQFGAQKLFDSNPNGVSDADEEKNIEEILEYSINKTEKIREHIKNIEDKLQINNLSLTSDTKNIYNFEGEDYKKFFNDKGEDDSNVYYQFGIDIGQRERKLINGNLEEKKSKVEFRRNRVLTGWKLKNGGGYSHQFFDNQTLDQLDEKERKWNEFLREKENPALEKENEQETGNSLENGHHNESVNTSLLAKESNNKNIKANGNSHNSNSFKLNSSSKIIDIPSDIKEFTKKDHELRQKIVNEGFSNWRKKDFAKFIRACEIYGCNDYENISKQMKSKTLEEVETYTKVFLKKINQLPNGKRILAKISKSETEKLKIIEFGDILEFKFSEIAKKNSDIYSNIKIPYKSKSNNSKGNSNANSNANDLFEESEDKYLLCLLFKYGYGNWNQIRNHIFTDPLMKFNFNMKVKSDQDFQDRAIFLINIFKQEFNKYKAKQRGSIIVTTAIKKNISKKKKKMKKRSR